LHRLHRLVTFPHRLAEKLNIEGFKGSKGYLERWKKRYKIQNKNKHGEAADCPDTKEWLESTLPDLLAGYEARDVYNADETGLFFKVTPDRTFAFSHEVIPGRKCAKDRLTILFVSNMDGSHKWKPVVIGRVKKPRRLKNVHRITVEQLPVTYRSNKSAWMNTVLFKEFMQSFNSFMVHNKRKVILFLDNASSHTQQTSWSNVRVEFLPPNSTSKLQPMDQGIIRSFKGRYRADLAKKYLFALNSGKPLQVFRNEIDLKVACDMICRSWKEIPESVLQESFKHAGFNKSDLRVSGILREEGFYWIDRNIWQQIAEWNQSTAEKVGFEEYIDYEKKIDQSRTAQEMTLDEIVAEFKDPEIEGESDDEDVDFVKPAVPDTSCAMEYISHLRTFCQRNSICYETLDRFEGVLKLRMVHNLKQAYIGRAFETQRERIERMRQNALRMEECRRIEIEATKLAEQRDKEELARLEREANKRDMSLFTTIGKDGKKGKSIEVSERRVQPPKKVLPQAIDRDNPILDPEVVAGLDKLLADEKKENEDRNPGGIFTTDLGLNAKDLECLPPGSVVKVSVFRESPLGKRADVVDAEGSTVSQGHQCKLSKPDDEKASADVVDVVVVDSSPITVDDSTESVSLLADVPMCASPQEEQMEIDLPQSASQNSSGFSYTVTDTGNAATMGSPSQSQEVVLYDSFEDEDIGSAKLISGPIVDSVTNTMSKVVITPPPEQNTSDKEKPQSEPKPSTSTIDPSAKASASASKTKAGMRKLTELFKTGSKPSGLSRSGGKNLLSRSKQNKK